MKQNETYINKEEVMKWFKLFTIIFAGMVLFTIHYSPAAFANNISVSNVVLQNQDTENSTVEVSFDVTWQNPFSGTDANTAAFYDKAWICVKYWVVGTDSEDTGWHHATLTTGGTVTPTSDGKGAFVDIGANQTVKWYYVADSVSGAANIRARVIATEMVYIPQGAFVYNAGGIGGSDYNNYGAGSQTNVTSAGDLPTGCAAGWPNGYSAFYIAKYEVSQGQYVDFLNMLTATQATARFEAFTNYEHEITYTSGNDYGARYATTAPNRASARISWDDAKAYASWCAMRPMTEMEFEKAARGGGTANTNLYPWGSANPETGNSLYTPSGNTAPYDAWQYYANFYDGGANSDTYDGPTDVGLYLSGDITRTNAQTGASIYGVADLAGNVWEHLINCAHTTLPLNGDGSITAPASWPNADAGKGIRGGAWCHGATYLRVSARSSAGWTITGRYYRVGVRVARTSP